MLRDFSSLLESAGSLSRLALVWPARGWSKFVLAIGPLAEPPPPEAGPTGWSEFGNAGHCCPSVAMLLCSVLVVGSGLVSVVDLTCALEVKESGPELDWRLVGSEELCGGTALLASVTGGVGVDWAPGGAGVVCRLLESVLGTRKP